jgi:hypothetical protein
MEGDENGSLAYGSSHQPATSSSSSSSSSGQGSSTSSTVVDVDAIKRKVEESWLVHEITFIRLTLIIIIGFDA